MNRHLALPLGALAAAPIRVALCRSADVRTSPANHRRACGGTAIRGRVRDGRGAARDRKGGGLRRADHRAVARQPPPDRLEPRPGGEGEAGDRGRDSIEIGGFTTFEAALGYRLEWSPTATDITLRARNVTDTLYAGYTDISPDQLTLAPPRSVDLMATVSY